MNVAPTNNIPQNDLFNTMYIIIQCIQIKLRGIKVGIIMHAITPLSFIIDTKIIPFYVPKKAQIIKCIKYI